MDVDGREEQLNIDYIGNLPLGGDIILDSDNEAPSDTTYVDENDIANTNAVLQPETNSSATYQSESTSSILGILCQELRSSNNEDYNSCTSPSKKRPHSETQYEEDDSQLCSICLDYWTTSGEHRLCSLKCGHLFGYNCVIRWIDLEAKRCCPTCKKKAHTHDIRYIYAKKVTAVDTTELTITKKKLESVIEEKNRVQIELSKAICKVHTLTGEVDDYKKKLSAMMYIKQSQNEQGLIGSQSSKEEIHLYKEKTVHLGKNTACRVFDCTSRLDLVAISMYSSNNLYSGFGLKIFNLSSFKSTAFIGLHNLAIRDVKIHETEPWLLSCSIDKQIRVVDLNSNAIITTLDSQNPLWSCCWDIKNDRMLYVGQQQGSVLKFDMREPSRPLSTMSIEGDYSPVVSVQAVKPSHSEHEFDTVVSCKLNSAWVFETSRYAPEEHMRSILPFDGPFVSMINGKENEHLFLSSRPSAKCPYSRHYLCVLNKRDNSIKCDVVHTFRGGSTQKMLTRTCFLSNVNDYVAAYVEDQRCVALWNINTGNKVGSVPAHEAVFDLNSVKKNCDNFLLSLTESKLEFFKFAK